MAEIDFERKTHELAYIVEKINMTKQQYSQMKQQMKITEEEKNKSEYQLNKVGK